LDFGEGRREKGLKGREGRESGRGKEIRKREGRKGEGDNWKEKGKKGREGKGRMEWEAGECCAVVIFPAADLCGM